MQTYSIILKEKVEIADQTYAFIFEKPATFLFEAGQYVVMTLPELKFPDERRGIRSLSIASAPYEDTLMFAMRITSSGFKKTLMNMNAGDAVTITQAFGHFILPQDSVAPIIFLIGGIGITPARSILKQAAHMQSNQPFLLFYSNRAPKDVAFAQELQSIQGLENYRCIDTMTNSDDICEWSEESGYICKDMLEKYSGAYQQLTPYYFLVGSPLFIKAMEDMLHEMNVMDEYIKKDPFTGI